MADDDDLTMVNEEENELDNMLRANGYDPAEYTLAEKREVASDMVGDSTPAASDEIDYNSDQLRGSVPADERDSSDLV
jgi:hypothetical protein